MSMQSGRAAFRVWDLHPQAAAIVADLLAEACARCPPLAVLKQKLLTDCAVRLVDVVDHFAHPEVEGMALAAAGWREQGRRWRHDGGHFPDILPADRLVVGVSTDCVEGLARACGVSAPIEGEPLAPLRRVTLFTAPGLRVEAIERNGAQGCVVAPNSSADLRAARIALQTFRARRREFDDPARGLAHTEALVANAVGELGPHWACALFLRAEREFWASRCEAGRLQGARQDQAGIGWANVDHHTYDSSREAFAAVIRILETLGYQCRELFYAGHQAGWGSQILEQPVLRSTIFADIDLAPDELDIDFAHLPLEPLPKSRRAGLWCAMHGESMLQAGLNHVAGMYDHQALDRQLEGQGLRLMAPFSDLPHLHQALTAGEWRAVDPVRLDGLERAGHLTGVEAEDFRLNGAIACHLENLERNGGYKGFNQPGIDGVLKIIDPRSNLSGSRPEAHLE